MSENNSPIIVHWRELASGIGILHCLFPYLDIANIVDNVRNVEMKLSDAVTAIGSAEEFIIDKPRIPILSVLTYEATRGVKEAS